MKFYGAQLVLQPVRIKNLVCTIISWPATIWFYRKRCQKFHCCCIGHTPQKCQRRIWKAVLSSKIVACSLEAHSSLELIDLCGSLVSLQKVASVSVLSVYKGCKKKRADVGCRMWVANNSYTLANTAQATKYNKLLINVPIFTLKKIQGRVCDSGHASCSQGFHKKNWKFIFVINTVKDVNVLNWKSVFLAPQDNI